MGLSRYIKNEYYELQKELKDEKLENFYEEGIIVGYTFKILQENEVWEGTKIEEETSLQLEAAKKFYMRHKYNFTFVQNFNKNNKVEILDNLDKIEKVINIDIEELDRDKKYYTYHWFGFSDTKERVYYKMNVKKVKISRFFLDKFEEKYKEHNAKLERKLNFYNKLGKYEEKVYRSRNFPTKLRQLIFERDGYTCQKCGKDIEVLKKEKNYLEVNHIIPWVDGGKTTLKNGETVCKECNIGLHHAKEIKDFK